MREHPARTRKDADAAHSQRLHDMRDADAKRSFPNWRLQKRRLQLQLRTSFGKEAVSADDLYEQHVQRFGGLLQKVLDIRQSLDDYRTKALPLYSTACAGLGADVWCVVSADAVGKGTDAEKFRHAMCAVNETKEVKNHFHNADAILSGAIRFLDIHINAMKSVRSQIERRKRLKLEFDCYDRKVCHLRAKSSVNARHLERNEQKLAQAREALQTSTFELYKVFAKYESERDTMLNGELEMVRQVMHNFYVKNAEATDFVISEEVDRNLIKERTDQIFQAMMAKELEKSKAALQGPLEPQQPAFDPVRSSQPPMPVPPPPSYGDNQQHEEVAALNFIPPPPPPPAPVQQPAASDDDLATKLRTISLTMPQMPKLKPFYIRR